MTSKEYKGLQDQRSQGKSGYLPQTDAPACEYEQITPETLRKLQQAAKKAAAARPVGSPTEPDRSR